MTIRSHASALEQDDLRITRGTDNTLTISPAKGSGTSGAADRLRQMFALRGDLERAGALRPLELRQEAGQLTLVCADPGGTLLREMVAGRTLEIAEVLQLAVAIASALARFHACGLIHRDLKPESIWIAPGRGEAWLAGTGLAVRSSRPTSEPPAMVVGTPAYMAPEQTGRVNRPVDSRTDLYALGVILYELATSRRPFASEDPLELIHSHVAREPVPVAQHRASLPDVFSRLVSRLLAKDAEGRYQTAAGLVADLQRCLASWQTAGTIEDFALGDRDRPARPVLPARLFGREAAAQSLAAAFARVATTGNVELLLVAGYSGVGKSSLVHELQISVTPARATFCTGKLDQRRGDVPYATMIDALGELVGRVLCLPRRELTEMRDAIVAALGGNAGVVCALVPEIEKVIGRQPPAAEVSARESQLRLHRAIVAFLGVFARADHPLVLFVDDLQWLDSATLDLLEHIATQTETRHLLLLGAYRDNETPASHPLRTRLARMATAGAAISEVELHPLGLEHVSALLSASLDAPADQLEPLAKLIFARTHGNPFFAIQLLCSLAEERLLTYSPVDGRWEWSLQEILGRGLTEDVAVLLAQRITRLAVASQRVLQHLACLGTPADAATLARVCGSSPSEVAAALDEAAAAGLLMAIEGQHRFAHDRVGEAAYTLVSAPQRDATHLAIARRLDETEGAIASDETVFSVVAQYNRASQLVAPGPERLRVAALNLAAAQRARKTTAHASALTYASIGVALLADEGSSTQPAWALGLHLLQAECRLLTGAASAAEADLAVLSDRVQGAVDRAAITCLQIDLYTLTDRSDRGVEVALRYLASVGIAWTARPSRERLDDEYGRFRDAILARGVESLASLPLMSDPAVHATMDVLTKLQVPAMFSDENLAGMVLARMANLSLAYGNSPGSCFAYGWLAGFTGSNLGDHGSARALANVALQLVERPELGRYRARVYCLYGYLVTPWIDHLRAGQARLLKAHEAARAEGDVTFVCYTSNHAITLALGSGAPLAELEVQAEEGRELARKAAFGLVVDFFTGQLRLIRSLQSSASPFTAASDDNEREEDFEARMIHDPLRAIAACWYWIRKLQARYHARDYVGAEASARHASVLLWTSTSDFEIAEYCFYAALTQTALAARGPAAQAASRSAEALRLQTQMSMWARGCPANFAHRAALIEAERAALEGEPAEAERAYAEAARLAQDADYPHDEGLSLELAARFHAARGEESRAEACRSRAIACYRRWGATALVERLGGRALPSRAEDPVSIGAAGWSVDQMDLATIIAVSQSVSSEIEIEPLVRTIVASAAAHAGAQRVVLILAKDEALTVVAEAVTGRDGLRTTLASTPVADAALPASMLRYVARAQEAVDLANPDQRRLFDDARAGSVLCMPLVVRASLVGLIYLEHTTVANAFTPKRIQLLRVLVAQAATALENARLYAELKLENAERRRAEELLAREKEALFLSEERFRQFADALPDVVWITELDPERVVYCSPSFERIWGYTVAELYRQPRLWTDSIHPDDRARVGALFSRWVSGEAPLYEDIEFRIVRPDGTIRWIREFGVATRSRQGVPFRVSGLAADITERKLALEATQRAQAELARINRIATMGELTASIAHEVSQPLAAILTNASACARWLAATPPALEQAGETVARIVRDGRRAADVINRVRALFQKNDVTRERFGVDDLIADVQGFLGSDLRRRRVELHVSVDSATPDVWGNRVQIQQVLLNLVLNALDAIEAGAAADAGLDLSAAPSESGFVEIAVHDRGVGFAEGAEKRIFDAFYTTKASGMGMGLAITRSIVEAHGGSIRAHGNDGPGATLRFTIPTWEAVQAAHTR